MKERLLKFLDYKGLTKGTFERICGIAAGSVANTKGNMTQKTLGKIALAYPELSQNWLLTGEGEMLKPTGGLAQSVEKGFNIGNHNSGNIASHHEVTNYTGLSNSELIAILEDRFQYVLRKEEDVQGIYKENRDLIRKAMQQSDEYYKLNDYARALNDENKELKERIVALEKENDHLKKLNDGK